MIIKGWYYLCVAALTLTLAGCGNKNSNIDYYDPETLGFTVTREASINDFVGNGSEQHATATYEVSKKDFSMNGVGGLQDAYTYNVRGNVFAIGAGLGGLLSLLWGIYTIWFSVVLLLIDVLIMIKE